MKREDVVALAGDAYDEAVVVLDTGDQQQIMKYITDLATKVQTEDMGAAIALPIVKLVADEAAKEKAK